MFGLGWQELLLILIVLLILFGGKRLPELARGLGSGIKEFKKALREEEPQNEKPKEIEQKTEKKE
ncbi:sec-independent protein translocase protein TatA [Candidatus Kryptobacter tengchongensis]|uniref:Sec-independent protein translocase protein TatA n=1 Tax=Kryptobacter tengchongensis TaxID=1643429 RepID=A0A656DCU4_KRYT1|nr:twin-arginine translocase TatA/TatE family subunit [Candidatus Kryptobacter tengchongensis]CUS85823.1 sec-independent protein translocase protein TatA [Candidatus Kryptobacter tengchongensis]CUT00261.1 sec-independent protein translocase protein TatA [Candidatus Kryptobacter tengchongensis]CUU03320.1 sec-independent protein translocase protein TatA [Candidatus Kryptobacter tengchongensis]CUU10644.1 sec-independent protein translocase protein TatA [Candidatus Kryptobacter tengchongensis]